MVTPRAIRTEAPPVFFPVVLVWSLSHVQPSAEPVDCSLPGFSGMGFPRQEYWSGLPFPSPGIFPTRNQSCVSQVSCIGRWILYCWTTREAPFLLSPVLFSSSVLSDSLRPHGLQHARPPCPSPTPRSCSSSCPLSQWCHPTISFSVDRFSFCLQSFPASGSFPMSQFFVLGGQSIGATASASVLPVGI